MNIDESFGIFGWVWVIDCVYTNEQALFEALMQQEELLAYIDSQEEAKSRVSQKIIIFNHQYMLSDSLFV